MTIEVFENQADVLGEGPIWSVADQALVGWILPGAESTAGRQVSGKVT